MTDPSIENPAGTPEPSAASAPAVAATEPIPAASPVDAFAPERSPAVAAPYAPAPPAGDSVSVPKRWLVVGGGAVLAVVLIGGAFASGVAVGGKAARFGGGMPSPQAMPGLPGAQGDGGMMGRGRGWEDDSREDGYDAEGHGRGSRGGMRGLPGAPQGQAVPEGQPAPRP